MIPPLHTQDYGDKGPPILLLHGLGGGASLWAQVALGLSSERRVLVPDLLGFGRSPWPDAAYTVDDHLAALEELLEERGLATGPFDIAGHSMGAILAAELAARRPERAHRVALVSLPYFISETEIQNIAARLGLLARLTVGDHWGARAACAVMCALRPILIFLAPYLARSVPAAVAQDALRHNFTSYSRSLQNVIMRRRPDASLTALASRPVLLAHGDADRVVPVGNVRALAARFPHWRLEVLAGAGHRLPVEQPEELTELLSKALSRPGR